MSAIESCCEFMLALSKIMIIDSLGVRSTVHNSIMCVCARLYSIA